MAEGESSAGISSKWTPGRRAREAPLSVRAFRSLIGVLAALFFFIALDAVLRRSAGLGSGPNAGPGSPVLLAGLLVLAAVAAGYVAGWVAGRLEVVHGAVLGAFVGWGQGGLDLAWQGVPWELASYVGMALLIPAGAVGGGLRAGIAAIQERRAQEIAAAGIPNLPVEVRGSQALVWLGFVLSLVMTAGAGFVLAAKENPWLGLQGAGFFGLAALFLGYRALNPRPLLVVTEAGIEDGRLRASVPWSEVRGVRRRYDLGVSAVEFEVADPERFLQSLPLWFRAAKAVGWQGAGGEFVVNLTGTNLAAGELCEIVERELSRTRGQGPPRIDARADGAGPA